MVASLRAGQVAEIDGFVADASDDALRLVASVLRDDAANAAWRAQLGPCLTQSAASQLLGITPQAVAKRASVGELLRLTHRDGRPVYPVFQFQGRGVVAGLGLVLDALYQVDDPLTAASWLTVPKRNLAGRAPVDALRANDVESVVAAAAHYVSRSS